jgi:hypothetical protein
MSYEHAWQRLIEQHPTLGKHTTIEIDTTNLRKITKFFYDRGVKDADESIMKSLFGRIKEK